MVRYGRLQSFKITETGTDRQSIYDVLLVVNCNMGHILYRF